jgi:antitoxin component YwqK of YwqJK toxin-antitoxin module
LFEGIEEPYFTFIEDYVVFSNSKELLHQIIDDYITGRTISKDEKFQDFIDEFEVKSNIAVFINMPKMYPTLYYFTPPADRSDLKENEQLIESFAHIGFQLTSKNNMFRTTLIAEYDSTAYYDDLTGRLEAQTNNEIFTYYLDTMGFLISLPDDIPDGEFITYYDEATTKKMFEGNVVDGKPDGIWRSYYKSGNIENAVSYKDGQPDGVAYFYYDVAANTLRAEVNYEEGKIVGTYKEYYDNGARKAQILYDEGEKNGDAEFYYRTGDIKIEGKFKDDQKHGKWVYYDQNGKKIAVEKWKKGEKIKEK